LIKWCKMKTKLFFLSVSFCLLNVWSNKIFAQTLNFTINQQIYGYVLIEETGLSYPDVWDIEYWPSGTTGQSTIDYGVNQSGKYIQVNPFINWDFRVRRVASNIPQAWSDIKTLDNSCTAVNQYVGYNFNFNTNPVTECWRGIMTNGVFTSPYSQLLHNNGHISITSSTTLAHSSYLISPKFQDLGTDKKIKFTLKYTQTSSPARPIAIGTMTDPSNLSTFHLIKEVYGDATNVEKTVYLSNYNGIDKYIAFRTINSRGTFDIDDFKYEQSITCLDITNLNVNNISEHTAQINFTGPFQTNWEVYLRNTLNGQVQNFNINQNPYTIQNLLGNTTYEVKIRAVCDVDNYTNWTALKTFQTTCDNISAGYETSFDESQYLNKCWSTINTGS
jgi:Fibronectin type III domain